MSRKEMPLQKFQKLNQKERLSWDKALIELAENDNIVITETVRKTVIEKIDQYIQKFGGIQTLFGTNRTETSTEDRAILRSILGFYYPKEYPLYKGCWEKHPDGWYVLPFLKNIATL